MERYFFLLCLSVFMVAVLAKKEDDDSKDYKKTFFKKPDMRVNPFFGYNKYKVVKYTPPLLPPTPLVASVAYPAYTSDQGYDDESRYYDYQGQVPYVPPSTSYITPEQVPYEDTNLRSNQEMGQPSYRRHAMDHIVLGKKAYPDISSFIRGSTV
ncbi:uncharacterized protein LOC136034125 [Artemia franciscana]|uniref:uncharacterized protein LOC136034125 n=1 Tax=Artemia franciscana TaxID=6661 RepID=UPI0032D9B7AA